MMKFIKKHWLVSAVIALGLVIFLTGKDKLFSTAKAVDTGSGF